MRRIGELQSCFTLNRFTPRQALLAPSTRACIWLDEWVPADSLDGLEQFTHVWVVFVFHGNNNEEKRQRSAATASRNHAFRAKIKPPALGGRRIGLLATRTPHRPNPIGLTLCRIESVDMKGRRVVLSGTDMMDGTPVLDLKPFVPAVDGHPDARSPAWTAQRTHGAIPDRSAVRWAAGAGAEAVGAAMAARPKRPLRGRAGTRHAAGQLSAKGLAGRLERPETMAEAGAAARRRAERQGLAGSTAFWPGWLYSDGALLAQAVAEVLATDVRSGRMRGGGASARDASAVAHLCCDGVVFEYQAEDQAGAAAAAEGGGGPAWVVTRVWAL